jgi:hypothetical protein
MELNQTVYEKLKQVAKSQETISYLKLSVDCNLGLDLSVIKDRNILSATLENISTNEFRDSRPLLSAVVVYQNANPKGVVRERSPGPGFFEMARKLAVWKDGESKNAFYFRTLRECFEYWKNK